MSTNEDKKKIEDFCVLVEQIHSHHEDFIDQLLAEGADPVIVMLATGVVGNHIYHEIPDEAKLNVNKLALLYKLVLEEDE